MNVLYLGPFQLNNSLGYQSSFILENLCSINDIKVYAHPIYSGSDNTKLSNIPYFRFNQLDKYPDINIQHSTLSGLYVDTQSKNYFIPIHPTNKYIPKQYIEKLKAVDKILVYSDFEFNKFLDIGIQEDKIVKLSIPKITISKDKLSLGVYNTYYKYYFIGDYSNNKDIILSLIRNFLISAKDLQDICLVIASECNEQEKQELINIYEKEKQSLAMDVYEDKILLLVDDVSCSKIQSLHNACDTLLCLNDGYYPITDIASAKYCKNKIINYPIDNLDTEQKSHIMSYIITNQTIRQMINNDKHTITEQDKYPTIDIKETLC